jgi:hypothetical protein
LKLAEGARSVNVRGIHLDIAVGREAVTFLRVRQQDLRTPTIGLREVRKLPAVQTLLGLVVFAGLVALGFWGLQAGGSVPQAVILLLSAGVGFGVWKAQDSAKQTQELEDKLGSDKKVLYKLYLDVMREVVEQGDKAKAAEYVPKLRKWAFATLLIASDEVVLAHDRFLNASRVSDDVVIAAVADVILAMRRDVGDETTNLKLIDIVATFIRSEDIEAMRPLCEQWEREKAQAWPLSRVSRAKQG